MADDLAAAIRDEFLKLLEPLTSAASAPNGTSGLLLVVGHIGELGNDPGLVAEVRRIAQLADDIAALGTEALGSWRGMGQILDLTRDLIAAVRSVDSVLLDPALALRAQNLGSELTTSLLALYIRTHHPVLFRTGAILGIITPAERATLEPLVVGDGGINRLPWARDRFHFDRISALVEDPRGVLRGHYLPNGMEHAQDAYLAAGRLFPLLRDLAKGMKLGWVSDFVRVAPDIVLPAPDGEDGDVDEPFDDDNDMFEAPDLDSVDPSQFQSEYRPRFAVYLPSESIGTINASRVGLLINASSAEHPDRVRGFILAPVGEGGWSENRRSWRLELLADGSIPAFVLGPNGVDLAPLESPLTVTASFMAERLAEVGQPAFLVGPANGTRLEVGALRFRVDLALSPLRRAIAVSMEASSGALVLAAPEGDGFMRAVLPQGGARAEFDFGVVVSSDRGLELKGGSGLALLLSPSVSIGPVTVLSIRLQVSLVRHDNLPALELNKTTCICGPPVLLR